MKKLLAILLTLLLMCAPLGALAEDIIILDDGEGVTFGEDSVDVITEADEDEVTQVTMTENLITSAEFGDFIVGATTKLNGAFFTNMWGNNTCDIDVRSVVHGLETIYWDKQSSFLPNPIVIAALGDDTAENGDKTYTITLHHDLLYNDGSQITAKDYVFCLMLLAAPQIKEIDGMTTNVGYITGFEDFNGAVVPYFSGLHLIDDYTFSITINNEYLPFFFEIGMLDATPYPISVIAPGCEVVDNGDGCEIVNIDKAIAEPIFTGELLRETILDPETGYMSHPYLSSGPWKMISFDWDTRIARFAINEYFKGDWAGFTPSIDNLVFKSVLPEGMIGELENRDVHLLNKVVYAGDIEEGLNAETGIKNEVYPRLGFGFINFSTEQGPTQFDAVRQAFAHATDEVEFVKQYNKNFGTPVYGYYGIGQWMVQMITQASTVEVDVTDEELDMLNALSLSGLNMHEYDLETAEQLLIDDGWTLNEDGAEYVKGTDSVRCKMVNDELMKLNIRFARMKDSVAVGILLDLITEPLAEIGITLEVTEVPFVELLEYYYRQRERPFDAMYLATNFISIFDPYFVFNTRDEYQGDQNTTGYRDAALEALALNMRRTEPGELLEYCQKWIAFQTYFAEKVPMLPLYGNMYYDFFVPELHNYYPNHEEMKNWPVALVRAYLAGDVETPDEIVVSDTEDLAATVDDEIDSAVID